MSFPPRRILFQTARQCCAFPALEAFHHDSRPDKIAPMCNASALLPKWVTAAVAFTMVGILLLPATAAAQQSGVISGSVIDSNNKPLPGVRISLTSREDVSQRRGAVTDAKGRYEIGDLRSGMFVITAELPGFSPGVKIQRVTNDRREVWLALEPGVVEERIPSPGPRVRILPLQEDR